MKRLSSRVVGGALLFFALGYFLVLVGKGQEHPDLAKQHIGLFYRGQMVAEIYADDMIKTNSGVISFYRAGNLVITFQPDAGLIWKSLTRWEGVQ